MSWEDAASNEVMALCGACAATEDARLRGQGAVLHSGAVRAGRNGAAHRLVNEEAEGSQRVAQRRRWRPGAALTAAAAQAERIQTGMHADGAAGAFCGQRCSLFAHPLDLYTHEANSM